MFTIPVTIMSMIYMILLVTVYFSKKRISTHENKIYSTMIKLSCFGIIVDAVSSMFVVFDITNSVAFFIVTKFMFVYYVLWSGLLLSYTVAVSVREKGKIINSKTVNKLIMYILAFYVFCSLLAIFLPLTYHKENGVIYPEGLSVNFTYFIAGFLSISLMVIILMRNYKYINAKKYIPIYSLLVLFTISVVVQKNNPQLILTTTVECFITFLMYFTVENPDVQIMEELYKNKKLVEKSSEDTSNFLFMMTQDIKRTIKDIIKISSALTSSNDIEAVKTGAKAAETKAKELDYLVNDVLDISKMSNETIKPFKTRYNPQTIFKELKYLAENKLNSKVEFEYKVAGNIPHYLYGDSIKIKQVVSSVLDNAIKNTKEGFISLNVDLIIKYDICRLLITISDSGRGMNIDEVNDIISLNIDELSKIKLSDEKKIYNLKEVKKLIMYLGGNLIVNSEPSKGTTVSITIDQKIVETKNLELSKKIDLYEQSLHTNKKVMVVDDDAKELAKITSELEKIEANVSSSLFGRDIIEKISNNQKFDLIILDDETSTYSGLEVLKELKKNPKFNTPVVIMIDDRKAFIKHEYLNDGFSDVILKSKLKSELKRIIERF